MKQKESKSVPSKAELKFDREIWLWHNFLSWIWEVGERGQQLKKRCHSRRDENTWLWLRVVEPYQQEPAAVDGSFIRRLLEKQADRGLSP